MLYLFLSGRVDTAAKRTSAEAWLWDGIHLTVAGHHLLAERWLEVVGNSGCLGSIGN